MCHQIMRGTFAEKNGNSHNYHTTKITVTFVISYFDIPKLETLQKLNYLYNTAPSKYIILK